MVRTLVLILALASSAAFAQQSKYASENQSTTRAAPTAASFTATNTDGSAKALELGRVISFRVTVCAPSAQTLAGAGTLHAYLYSRKWGTVSRNPALDLSISVTATSCNGAACQCQAFPNQSTGDLVGPGDVLIYAANGVTLSAGTTVDVYYTGSIR
jgi:hypothetical protein